MEIGVLSVSYLLKNVEDDFSGFLQGCMALLFGGIGKIFGRSWGLSGVCRKTLGAYVEILMLSNS